MATSVGTRFDYIQTIARDNPKDFLSAVSLVVEGFGFSKFGENVALASSGASILSIWGDGVSSVAGARACYSLATADTVDKKELFSTAVDLTKDIAWVSYDVCATAQFAERTGVIAKLSARVKILTEGFCIYASTIGLFRNIWNLFHKDGEKELRHYTVWQNGLEAGASLLTIVMSVVAVAGIILESPLALVLSIAYLVCVFAGYIVKQEKELTNTKK